MTLKEIILKFFHRFHFNWFQTLSLCTIFSSLACVFITYSYILFPTSGDHFHYERIGILLSADFVLFFALCGFIIWKIYIFLQKKKQGKNTDIHIRLTVVFAALSAIPTVIILLSSLLFFSLGLETWFGDRVKTAINQSQNVSHAYLKQTKDMMIKSALWLGSEIDENAIFFSMHDDQLQLFLNQASYKLGVSNAIVFSRQKGVLARSGLTFAFEFDPVTQQDLWHAINDGMAVLTNKEFDTIRVIVPLQNYMDGTFLMVGQFIDPHILLEIRKADEAYSEYTKAEEYRSYISFSFILSFLIIAAILLFVAINIGEMVANHVSRPVSSLLSVIQRIQKGDFSMRVLQDKRAYKDEFYELAITFNHMLDKITMQQKNLWNAAEQINKRREFTETILETISTAVISLNAYQVITLANQSSSMLLEKSMKEMVGSHILDVFPNVAHLLNGDNIEKYEGVDQQVRVNTPSGVKVFVLKMVVKRNSFSHIYEYVITFDDMSSLLEAQRNAAWQNVARRIAHDIKNPLTPIQLATERLQRNYIEKKKRDMTVFFECTETILRQVDTIRELVNEFSSFAVMPVPHRQLVDIVEICKQNFFLQKHAHHHVNYVMNVPSGGIDVNCDKHHLSQLFTNILQNAYEAIQSRVLDDPSHKGEVKLSVVQEDKKVKICIQDNGVGISESNKPYITDPYMTTKEKGTGLGLAIVLKIVQDHNGNLFFKDVPGGGTCVCIQFDSLRV